MMQHTIVITYPLRDHHREGIKSAFPGSSVYFLPDGNSNTSALSACDVYFGHLTEAEFEAMTSLKFVQVAYAGVDGLLFPKLRNSEIVLSSAKGIHNVQMSELLFSFLLHFGRNMPAWQEGKRKRSWDKSGYKEGYFLAGKNICIVGFGTIGKRIARIARSFDMSVTGIRSGVAAADHPDRSLYADKILGVGELRTALAVADIVVDILPLTDETENFFSEDIFAWMKHGVVFVNLGRGKTVVDQALLNALGSGKIRFAALDVFREEPLPADHPFWEHERIFLTPHIGGLTDGYWKSVIDLFIENVRRIDRGETPLNVVDKIRGY